MNKIDTGKIKNSRKMSKKTRISLTLLTITGLFSLGALVYSLNEIKISQLEENKNTICMDYVFINGDNVKRVYNENGFLCYTTKAQCISYRENDEIKTFVTYAIQDFDIGKVYGSVTSPNVRIVLKPNEVGIATYYLYNRLDNEKFELIELDVIDIKEISSQEITYEFAQELETSYQDTFSSVMSK